LRSNALDKNFSGVVFACDVFQITKPDKFSRNPLTPPLPAPIETNLNPMKCLAMIPARMGSQRLAKKNLRELDGIPLITRAIRKCLQSRVFDEVWVNSEHPDFGTIAREEKVGFHLRPESLGNNQATSEQYVAEFLESHPCDFVVQVHSIAPLLRTTDIQQFVNELKTDGGMPC
jgi:CMP-N-acetylneuraminic acid synthetase